MNPTSGTATSVGNHDESCGFTETGYSNAPNPSVAEPAPLRIDLLLSR
jgi:hypothetical protein